jgi:hypothetical protein
MDNTNILLPWREEVGRRGALKPEHFLSGKLHCLL